MHLLLDHCYCCSCNPFAVKCQEPRNSHGAPLHNTTEHTRRHTWVSAVVFLLSWEQHQMPAPTLPRHLASFYRGRATRLLRRSCSRVLYCTLCRLPCIFFVVVFIFGVNYFFF